MVSKAIQQLLNVNNIKDPDHPRNRFNKPKIETFEFIKNEDALISYPDDIEDNMPDMFNGAIFNKNVLHPYDERQEENRK